MKYGVFCALALVIAFIAQTNAICHQGDTIMETGEQRYITCGIETCKEDGSVVGVGCGQYQCAEGKQIGYNEGDKTKVYPDCCNGPICAD